MESAIIIGIILTVIGALFLAIAVTHPENNIVYEILKGAPSVKHDCLRLSIPTSNLIASSFLNLH
jgi:hypothetical protein